MKKKLLSIALASTMVLGAASGAFAEEHKGLELEIHTSNPYINGYEDGTFRPGQTVKRAEVAKMVAVMKELGTEAGTDFEDSKGHWAAGFIGAVKAAGIVEGDDLGNFNPEAGLKRAELATIVSRIIGEQTDGEGVALSDIDGHWAKAAIENVAKAGIIKGYEDGSFKPEQKVTRAESVKLLNGVLSILEIDDYIVEKVESPFSDISGFWAERDIIAASTDYDYTLDADGHLHVLVKADVSAYEAALAAVSEEDYTEESWTAYQLIVEGNVVTAYDTQEDIDAATAAIVAAQEDLVQLSEEADLAVYNSTLSAVSEADYTTASWTAYQAVVEANVVTVSNTQEEVNAAVVAILAAQEDLVELGDVSAYEAALEAVTQTDYTEESWTIYQAVVAANVVTEQNTQAEIDAAVAAIVEAQEALVAVEVEEESELG